MELRETRPGRGQLPLSSGSFWAFWRSLQVQVQPIGIIVGAVWLLRPHLRLWMAMTAIVLLTRYPWLEPTRTTRRDHAFSPLFHSLGLLGIGLSA